MADTPMTLAICRYHGEPWTSRHEDATQCWVGTRPATPEDGNLEAVAAELATDNGYDWDEIDDAMRELRTVDARDYIAAWLGVSDDSP